MRGLKVLVIVMGVMLVGGVAALVATIAVRMPHRAAPSPGARFVAEPVALPAGARIESIGAGIERIVLAIALPDGARRLIVLDAASGRQLGEIPLTESK